MDLKSCVTLNNGVQMPWFGLGVFRVDPGDAVEQAVRYALDAGYVHIDTAAAYRNEAGVGRAVKASGIDRKDLFITTKCPNPMQREDRVEEVFAQSLEYLQTDYIDLYLIHWPVKEKYIRTWKIFEKLYRQGKIRAIGVSNFQIHHLEDLLANTEIVPAVNQVEYHPWLTQVELKQYCDEKGIRLEAWSPLAAGELVNDPTLTKIGAKYGKSAAQVMLRWDLQNGVITIPKSVNKERIIQNADIFDFTLSPEDMQAIFAMNRDYRTGAHPDTFTF